jgi:hypothetical protein
MSSGINEKLRRKSFLHDFKLEFKDISFRVDEPEKLIFTSPEVL